MPNPENTVQVAAQRAGESYLDTCELEADAIRPATSVAVSFRMTLPEFFAAEQELQLETLNRWVVGSIPTRYMP